MVGELEETLNYVQSSLNRKWGAMRFDTGKMGWEAADPIHTQVLTFEKLFLHFRNIGYKGGSGTKQVICQVRGTTSRKSEEQQARC